MTFLGPLSRAAALAGLLLSAGFTAAPAFAGPAEVALLKSYIGEWRGRGTLVGASTESVVCRLSLSQGQLFRPLHPRRHQSVRRWHHSLCRRCEAL
jgi:hypothetical protein